MKKQIIKTTLLAKDNHGYEYPLELQRTRDDGNPWGHWIVFADGAPSGWRLTSLYKNFQRWLDDPSWDGSVAFDLGQQWAWTNFKEILPLLHQFVATIKFIGIS